MKTMSKNLRQRVCTGAVLAILGSLLLGLSGHGWVNRLCATILSFCAVYELFKAVPGNWSPWFFRVLVIAAVALVWIPMPCYLGFAGAMLILSFFAFLYVMINLAEIQEFPAFATVIMALEFPFFYRAIPELRELEYGLYHLTAALLVCAATDVAAYFIGSRFGKNKFAPNVSPHKTVEGSVAGLAAAVLILALITLVWELDKAFSVSYQRLFVYALTASAVGQFGDLSMSSVKRIAGIKDYGTLLPGHGGILDRFDSLLFVLPYTYCFYRMLGPIVL